jgi:hypothetical protein
METILLRMETILLRMETILLCVETILLRVETILLRMETLGRFDATLQLIVATEDKKRLRNDTYYYMVQIYNLYVSHKKMFHFERKFSLRRNCIIFAFLNVQ